MTSFQDYLDLIKQRYTDAENRRDYNEAVRLLGLLADTCADQIQKLKAVRGEGADER